MRIMYEVTVGHQGAGSSLRVRGRMFGSISSQSLQAAVEWRGHGVMAPPLMIGVLGGVKIVNRSTLLLANSGKTQLSRCN